MSLSPFVEMSVIHVTLNHDREPTNADQLVINITCGLISVVLAAAPLHSQSIPKERQITHREHSPTPTTRFGDALSKRIKIPPSPPLTPAECLNRSRLRLVFASSVSPPSHWSSIR